MVIAGEPGGAQIQVLANGAVRFVWKQSNAIVGVDTQAAVVPANEWTHVAGSYDGTSTGQKGNVYINGTNVGLLPETNFGSGFINQPLQIGGFGPPSQAGRQALFNGLIDEVEVFSRPLDEDEVFAIYDAGMAGKCKDEDGDGFRPPEDCDESDPAINPDAIELPGNFVDENCDGDLGHCDPCADWPNHGQYVRCVSDAVNELVYSGSITESEGDLLVSSAAKSKVGNRGYIPPQCRIDW